MKEKLTQLINLIEKYPHEIRTIADNMHVFTSTDKQLMHEIFNENAFDELFDNTNKLLDHRNVAVYKFDIVLPKTIYNVAILKSTAMFTLSVRIFKIPLHIPPIVVKKSFSNVMRDIITEIEPSIDADKVMQGGIKIVIGDKTYTMGIVDSGDILKRFDEVLVIK